MCSWNYRSFTYPLCMSLHPPHSKPVLQKDYTVPGNSCGLGDVRKEIRLKVQRSKGENKTKQQKAKGV